MTDAALDFSIEGLTPPPRPPTPEDKWLERRTLGFGCSELPALFTALYGKGEGEVPRYTADAAKRLFAVKAGIAKPTKVGPAARKGAARERELLAHWSQLLAHGQHSCAEEAMVVRSSVQHADAFPRELFPLVDRHCPLLTCTPDAFARDVLGSLVACELKCSSSEKPELPWIWWLQVQGEIAVCNADYGLCIVGEMWSHWSGNDGPVRVFPVERDEKAIADIRDAVREGWVRVEKLKAEAKQ